MVNLVVLTRLFGKFSREVTVTSKIYQSVFHKLCSIVQKQKQFLWIMHQ